MMKRVWNILIPCVCLLLGLTLGFGIARTGQTKAPAETMLTQQDYQAALDRISVSGTAHGAYPSGSIWVDNRTLTDGLKLELTGFTEDGTPVRMSLGAVHQEGLPDGVRLVVQDFESLPEVSLRAWYEDASGVTIAERTLPIRGAAEKAG